MTALFHAPELWLALALLAFFVLFWFKGRALLVRVLDARVEQVTRTLDEAQQKCRQAEQILKDAEAYSKTAEQEATLILSRAESRGLEIIENVRMQTERMVERQRKQAGAMLVRAQAEARDALARESQKIMLESVRTLLSDALQSDQGDEVLATAIRDLAKSRLH